MKNASVVKALTVILFFISFLPLNAQSIQRARININLIIDGTPAAAVVKNEMTAWLQNRLNQILADGDSITVWNAGTKSTVIFTGKINNAKDRENVIKQIKEIPVQENMAGKINGGADFTGALKDAANKTSQSSDINYTIMICSSSSSLSSILSGVDASLLRYSRVEEFTTWRVLIIGLKIDEKVRKAASVFIGS